MILDERTAAWRFRVPLTQPLTMKGQSYNVREGVLLERDGQWAEASPLPGFSSDTLHDVLTALRGDREVPPSLAFALSSLEHKIESSLSVPFNQLLLGDSLQVLAHADGLLKSNCRSVKLKVGRFGLEQEIELVRRISQRMPEDVELRLDANQAWRFDEAVKFAKAIPDQSLAYIEEPLRDSSRLEELYLETGLPYALDESLLSENALDAWPNAAALVCKPTLLGGRSAVERLASTGKAIVFSAAFESGVGIARIMQLAAEFSADVAAGLDTLDWLSNDLVHGAIQKKGGWIKLEKELTVDKALLEPIEL